MGPLKDYYIEMTERYSAHNYKPLPVVLVEGEGVWVWDVEGRKYIDMLSSYSALNQGHRHPRIIKAMIEQLGRLTLTSRAFYTKIMAEFLKYMCELTGFEKALPMNTGAEAVETAIKLARKWGYLKKGVKENEAEIIVCENNFHGRTTTIISFSTVEQYRFGFGPYTPGFKLIPYDDTLALEKAINPNTVAFLVEPVQGEGGVNVPKEGYLRKIREITKTHNVLLILDEIQTGLGRTGKLFAYEHEGIKPDVLILGKALGGGVYPVSLVLAQNEVMEVFQPGDHGSTFGGNPLASYVAMESVKVIVEEGLVENARIMGDYFISLLKEIKSPVIKEIRGRGLLIGIDTYKEKVKAWDICLKLLEEGVLVKDTHETVIRFAPPLIIKKEEIDWAYERIKKVFEEYA